MDLNDKHLIGGTWTAVDDRLFSAFDPARGTPLDPQFHEAATEEVDQALSAAANAFADYRTCPPEARATFLEQIAEELVALGDELIERVQAETRLTAQRLLGERSRTVHQIRMFAELLREGSWVEASIDRAIPERQPMPKPDLRRMLIPLGPVVVFGASNFPLAFSVAGGDTASAFAAGNPVVVKAHPAHPGTCELVAHAVCAAATRETSGGKLTDSGQRMSSRHLAVAGST